VVLCEDCLRLSIGTEAENEILLKAIKSFVQKPQTA
jgi:histidinol-phosphate/aromatic aminotransferase/cobyric acid decarboxylase-like protein